MRKSEPWCTIAACARIVRFPEVYWVDWVYGACRAIGYAME